MELDEKEQYINRLEAALKSERDKLDASVADKTLALDDQAVELEAPCSSVLQKPSEDQETLESGEGLQCKKRPRSDRKGFKTHRAIRSKDSGASRLQVGV